MKRTSMIILGLMMSIGIIHATNLLIEAESFNDKGGWKVDQQFMDIMGSPYLIAHGMGNPVTDAEKDVTFSKSGKYHIYVRTYNWTSPWHQGKGPGLFTIAIDKKALQVVAGGEGNQWMWQYIGETMIKKGRNTVRLHDLTGFDGRCDAIYFSTIRKEPPSERTALTQFRNQKNGVTSSAYGAKRFDFVVAGAGIAGICAAVAASRQGLKVALVNDRPLIGGNNSSEIRVHLGGHIELEPYKNLGNLMKEIGPAKEGNAMPAENYEDEKKMNLVKKEKNITLFLNTHIVGVRMNGSTISEMTGQNIESGQRVVFKAPLYADCTGDGTVGALAGADYMMGREDKEAYGEERAVDKADKMTMGASVQWYSIPKAQPCPFPIFKYGIEFNEASAKKIVRGDWDWETGMNYDQIKDAEYIRDYGLNVVYSNWSFLKNISEDKAKFANLQLEWVAYIAGKRESRRLVGDYILNGNDLTAYKVYPDGTACTSWSIDLHVPEAENSKYFPGHEFISKDYHTRIYPYPVPYRCLYSRNVSNLFMAGRDVSVSHVALGTVRVMRTGGMLGEVVGLAATVCHQHHATPRDVYQTYFKELQDLMTVGAGKQGLPNNQKYNNGDRLYEKPGN